jgi:hypothetical protein
MKLMNMMKTKPEFYRDKLMTKRFLPPQNRKFTAIIIQPLPITVGKASLQ